MTGQFMGRVAVVTGASRGIGEATAYRLAAGGAAVVLLARNVADAERVAQRIQADGGRAVVTGCDVSNPAAVDHAVGAGEAAFGPVDILVNNAGMVDPIGRIASLAPADFDRTVAVNLNGAFYMIKRVLTGMLANGGGTIVNVSSGAAIRPLEGWCSYCVSKAGMHMLTQSLALEEGPHGIRVFGFQPGTVDTEMQGTIRASGINPISQMTREQHNAPDVPADFIAFLCSAAAEPFVGRELRIADADLVEAVRAWAQ